MACIERAHEALQVPHGTSIVWETPSEEGERTPHGAGSPGIVHTAFAAARRRASIVATHVFTHTPSDPEGGCVPSRQAAGTSGSLRATWEQSHEEIGPIPHNTTVRRRTGGQHVLIQEAGADRHMAVRRTGVEPGLAVGGVGGEAALPHMLNIYAGEASSSARSDTRKSE